MREKKKERRKKKVCASVCVCVCVSMHASEYAYAASEGGCADQTGLTKGYSTPCAALGQSNTRAVPPDPQSYVLW